MLEFGTTGFCNPCHMRKTSVTVCVCVYVCVEEMVSECERVER